MEVKDALAMFERYRNYWSSNYDESRIDLKMALGDPETHWGAKVYKDRKAANKSVAVINQLPQFIHQVTNDIRQNVPSLKALPDKDGDIETAAVMGDIFRAIEYRSHSDEVVDTAAEYAVKCGIGFMAVDHDYCDDESDEQEIIFGVCPDPLVHFMDPASIEYDGRDSNGHIELVPLTKSEFQRRYPGKKVTSFTDPEGKEPEENLTIAKIFVRESGGKRGKKITIKVYLFSGAEMLDESIFPGQYIPIVPILGEVTWVDGERKIASLIRQARGPSLRLQHWAAKETEILNMAPLAPVMAPVGVVVNDRGQWQSPGSEMLLEYNPTDPEGNPTLKPERLQPPPVPTGIVNAMEGAKLNIRESMGIYNAGLGKREGDASGRALEALDRSGDVATFHFPDNVRRSYAHMGEIVLEMIPAIYDTARVLQAMNEETEVRMIGVNGAPKQEGQKRDYDLTKGKYSVRVSTGASYTTKRQEEGQFLLQIAQKDPNFMAIGGDILFKSLDSPGSQALAERYKQVIKANNPALIKEDNEAPIDPDKIQMGQIIQQGAQEMQALQAQVLQLEQELKSKQGELAVKVNDTQAKTQMEMAKLQLQQQENEQEVQFKAAELQLKARELTIKEQELMLKAQEAERSAMQPSLEEPEMIAVDDEEALMGRASEITAQRQKEEQEARQREALLQGVLGIQQLLADQISATREQAAATQQLTAAVSAPKAVVYVDNDPTKPIIGVQ